MAGRCVDDLGGQILLLCISSSVWGGACVCMCVWVRGQHHSLFSVVFFLSVRYLCEVLRSSYRSTTVEGLEVLDMC